MDLESIWQQNDESDDMLKKFLAKEDFSKIISRLPLKKLKQNLLMGIIWGVLITAGYIVLFFFISTWEVYAALGILIIFNTWIMIDSWKLYKRTPDTVTTSFTLKQELEKNYQSFQRWWRIQERASLFVYPIALAGGFILGGVLGSGKPVDAFLYNPTMLSIMGLTMLVFIPACYYSARWMFRYAYGKHLKK